MKPATESLHTNNVKSEIKSELRCDMCDRLFYRKTRPIKREEKESKEEDKKGERQPTQINKITYWTKGKPWGKLQILCRGCLNDWFEKYRGAFAELVEPKMKKLYYYYRHLGAFKKEKEFYKGGL